MVNRFFSTFQKRIQQKTWLKEQRSQLEILSKKGYPKKSIAEVEVFIGKPYRVQCSPKLGQPFKWYLMSYILLYILGYEAKQHSNSRWRRKSFKSATVSTHELVVLKFFQFQWPFGKKRLTNESKIYFIFWRFGNQKIRNQNHEIIATKS